MVSVETKKKELIGEFKIEGRQQQPKGEPVEAYYFPEPAGKAIPYGICGQVR